MRNFKWSTVFQFTLIAIGFIIGIYFSIKANQKHAIEHGKIDFLTRMHHGYIDISNDLIIPEIIKLEVSKDAMSGWNLHIVTNNFQFTPSNVGSKHIPGEGHAHLMINGNKIARIYSNWFHISELEYEINEFEVTLNTNSHAIMSINSKPISIKLKRSELDEKL